MYLFFIPKLLVYLCFIFVLHFLQCLNLPNLFIYDSAYLFIFIFVQLFVFWFPFVAYLYRVFKIITIVVTTDRKLFCQSDPARVNLHVDQPISAH